MRPFSALLEAVFLSRAAATLIFFPQSGFISFGRSLGLDSSKMQRLAAKYALATTPAEVAEVACLTALEALGEAQVDTRPLNDATVQENWSQACWAEPQCIIQPRDANDVSTALKTIAQFQVRFSVRSGGHSPNPTWSSVGSDGLLLDLRGLDSVTISDDGSFASVGAGTQWGNVYSVLDSRGAFVLGARSPTIGVGGSILGGGFHHLSNEFGLAADSVKNVEIVLSNGTIVNANSTEHSDLFWALKGGGPNFGVATKFDLYTIPVYDAWVQLSVYAPQDAPSLIAAFDEWQKTRAPDTKSSVDLIISLDFAVLILAYSEPRAQPPAVFQPFFSVTPLQVVIPPMNLTFSQLCTILGSTSSHTPARHDYRGYSSRIDTDLTLEVYSFWREKALQVRQATGANQTFVLQHVSQNLIDRAAQNGGNALAIPQGPQQWWTTTIDWERAEDDDLVRSVSVDTTEKWEQLARERGLHVPFVFMNDASRDQSPLSLYGLGSLQRLKEVSRRYDPSQMFQTLQNGGFLLSKT